MKKKTRMTYIFIVILTLLIIGVLIIVYTNKNNTKINNNNKSNNDINNNDDVIETWSYIKHEFYNKEGNLLDNPYTLTPFILVFHNKYVEVCYEECYATKYTKENNILTIDNFEYFSGTYEVSYQDDFMILKNDNENTIRIVYYFQKPAG